jgi:predicted AAA+ superfamily ATPase
MERYLHSLVLKDLGSKMVFISGPRQCGKTTFAQELLKASKSGRYLNWDSKDDRKTILNSSWADQDNLIVLDEIHKYQKWKNLIKGIYDTQKKIHQFLITGSALLNVYRKGQDSLFGRYHHWRLHPFCLAENPLQDDPSQVLERLIERGGFPEPFLAESAVDAKRWAKSHMDLLIKEDLRDLSFIKDLTAIEQLYEGLRARVGSIISNANIARDIEVAPKTVKQWIAILESLYIIFSIKPYSGKMIRALTKPSKIYVFNNPEVDGDEGAKFENLVATHLLKRVHFLEDSMGEKFELSYLRDKEGREVDFVILKSKKPICLIEAKYNSDQPSGHLNYFGDKLKIAKRIQLVQKLKKSSKIKNIEIIPAAHFLSKPLDQNIFE